MSFLRLLGFALIPVMISSCGKVSSYEIGIEKWWSAAGYGKLYELKDKSIVVSTLNDFRSPNTEIFHALP